ncbi:helix-turn-helix transcriptional regulator [Thiobacillus sp.]|jgi:predicted DNA-binding transcriptional regulator AlpA
MAMKTNIPSDDRLFGGAIYASAKTIAHALETSETTVWRWSASGKLPKPHRLGGGTTRWRTDEVRAALAMLAAG